jgi:hypothetical protein
LHDGADDDDDDENYDTSSCFYIHALYNGRTPGFVEAVQQHYKSHTTQTTGTRTCVVVQVEAFVKDKLFLSIFSHILRLYNHLPLSVDREERTFLPMALVS